MAMISLHDVTKVYQAGARPALSHVNLTIERGEFVFLVGASGSGKTTLLQLLLHEQEANEGEIHVAGTDLRRIPNRLVPKYRRNLGFVFQDYKLLAGKTVWENVAFALQVIGARRSVIRSLVPQALEMVGLTGMEDRLPHELSGGEAQRVAIARAYVNHPQILLADEPTGNLDPSTSVGIMQVLDTINRTSNTTIVMATHNEEIVNSMRKRVVEVHLGKIVRDEEHGRYDSSLYNPDHHNVGVRRGAGVSRGESESPSWSEADSQNAQGSQASHVSNPTGEQAVVHAAATGAETPATGEQDVASGEQAQAQVEQPLAQVEQPLAQAKTEQTSVAAEQDSDDAEQASEEASEQTSKETSQDASQQANQDDAPKPLNPPAAPDTITELARNLRSGHTGRYGEVFQSAEDTMTWGMGLDDGVNDGSDDKEDK
ncbi:ATP-binding cassette domain-containing protein [Aeriscardovia aeriphila]|uniref:Cell division protein FtsE n=1 Tax=Aeriscardovia aeriphila TaxID=218139 RepID=A0A261FBD4_9BIFI|nr:ATP-binding cassette domain-containing protein [Aeriscardovia aeriphila]NYI25432.1 cell division transport system ATP-binding protein [Aeriscardovia aeriphila]OZG56414.1 cell division protein FtsE [Aeriscardovia aeriphila]